MGSETETVRKKNKARFNFVDVFIVAILLFVLFLVLFNLFFSGREEQRLIFLGISKNQAQEADFLDVSLRKGTAVYDFESGELLGRLYEDYDREGRTVVLVCEIGRENKKWFCGDRASVEAEGIIFENVVVTDVRKVTDYGENKNGEG